MNKQLIKWLRQFLKRYGLVLLIGFIFGCCGRVIMSNIIYHSYIVGNSMDPTLHDNEQMFGVRLKWIKPELKRGDIISFYPPVDDDEAPYVKRIVGLPGETLIIKHGKIYINGSTEPLDEPYLSGDWTKFAGPYYFKVPDHYYLVMGDNRNDSFDSRSWDDPYVSYESIEAKAYVVFQPVFNFRYLY